MASGHAPPHLTTCDCASCPGTQVEDSPDVKQKAAVAMTHERKDYFDEGPYEPASDSDAERTRKDERIRQAPYLPRIQVWARDNGPYTLRVGQHWFHCDDLLINGEEYRQQVRRATAVQPARQAQPNNQPGYVAASKRRPLNRAGSYQRTRPDPTTASRPTTGLVRQPSKSAGYESQALLDPRRKQASRKADDGAKKKTGHRRHRESETPPRVQADGNIAPEAFDGQLVPYKPPAASDPFEGHSAPKPLRQPRPGRLSRGNSYQIPVRSKGKKNVRFAALPS